MNPKDRHGVRGLILTGGLGVRLRPLTLTIPKPLLPLGDTTPVIEVLIRRLVSADIHIIHIALGYLGRLLRAYLETMPNLGARCELHQEKTPLGTAGPLALIPKDISSVVVCNGDILTDLNFRTLLKAHRASRADMTVVGVDHVVKIPYGSLTLHKGRRLREWNEGHCLRRLVSGGIYVVNRTVMDMVKRESRVDMPDLVRHCVKKRKEVRVFKHEGIWFDIGNMSQYESASAAFTRSPRHFIPKQ